MHSELPLPSTQFAHHAETLARVRAHFAAQPDVSAVLLGGSIAHGFASVQSDVDIAIVVPDEQFQDRLRRADTCFFSRELCTYPEGYVDGKYISEAFLDQVAQRGSEPARFAFQDVQVVFNHSPSLLPRVAAAARYPSEDQAEPCQHESHASAGCQSGNGHPAWSKQHRGHEHQLRSDPAEIFPRGGAHLHSSSMLAGGLVLMS